MMDRSTNPARPKLKMPGFFDEVFRTILFVIVVTVLFDMAIPRSLVDGSSMQPTYENGERLIVSRIHYLLRDPIRGDVLVFNSLDPAEAQRGVMLIKRVIGLPGETLEFRDRQLYINGVLVDEPYIREACSARCDHISVVREDGITTEVDTITLGADEYFVMGDNRNNSHDSRRFGPVPIGKIVGHVVFRYWPILRIGIVGERTYPIDA